MKNITMSVDDGLLTQARRRAAQEHRTLNTLFRKWLESYTAQSGDASAYDALMDRMQHVSSGRKFSREEANERR
jgi:hypothetical protein